MKIKNVFVAGFLLFSSAGWAQGGLSLEIDTNRVVSDSILEVFRSDSDFQYVVPKQFSPKKSWLEKWRSLKNEILRKLQAMQSSRNFQISLIVVAFIVLAYFFANLGFRRKRVDLDVESANEWDRLYQKVKTGDTFLTELAGMETSGEFRAAIRWIFLRYLSTLEHKGHIQWQSGKTNMDYYRELKNSGLESDFLLFMKTYNISWFGYHDIQQDDYLEYKVRVMKSMDSIMPKDKDHEGD